VGACHLIYEDDLEAFNQAALVFLSDRSRGPTSEPIVFLGVHRIQEAEPDRLEVCCGIILGFTETHHLMR